MSNNKQNRKKGTTPSVSKEFPNPITSDNMSTAEYNFTDKERIERNNSSNKLF